MAKKNGKPQDKVKEFHSNLKQAGFSENEIGTADQFKGAFETQEKASKFYDNLVGTEKVSEKEIGTKEQFLNTFQGNFKKKAESEPTSPTSEKPSQRSGRQLSDGLSDITGEDPKFPTDRELMGEPEQEKPQQLEGGPITAPEQPDEEKQIEQNTSRTINQFESISNELEKVEDNISGKSYAKALSPSSIDESEINQLKKQKEQLSEQLDRKREPVINRLQDLASNAVDEKSLDNLTQQTAESELTEGEAVGKAPDPAKAREKANELVKQYGAPEDGRVARLLENEIKARVEHKLNEPEIEKKFNEKFKNEFGKSLEQFKKDSEMDANLDAANRAIEQAKVETEIANVKQELDKEFEQQAENRVQEETGEIQQQVESVKQTFQQQKQQVQQQAQQIRERLQRGEISQEQAQQLTSQLEQSYQEQAQGVQEKLGQANEQLLDTFNQVKSNLKDKYNEQLKDVQQLGQEKLKERLKDWEDDPNIDQPTKQQINKLYKQSAVDVYQKEEQERQAFKEALSEQWFGKSLQFAQSIGSTGGGAIKNIASMMDFDAMRTFGESMERYFNPPQDAEREWSDLLDPNEMATISGQFAGSTAPSFLAGGLTAALTGGLGAGAGATMAASGFVSGAMETMQIGGAEFEQGLTETKSFQEAQRRMNESIKGQIAISPLYALEGLPFVPSVAGKVGRKLMGGSKVARPSLAKRTVGASAGELGTEFAQELTQESFAESIRKGGKWHEGFQNILDADKAKQTFINVSPAAIMGGGPQVMSSVMSPEQQAGKFIKAQGQKESLKDFAPDQQKQHIVNVSDVHGANRGKELVEGYYANGNIDKATKQDLEATIDRNEELSQEADEIGLEEGQKKVFKALNIKRQEAERKMEETDSESVKKSYDRKVKEIQGQIDNLINEGQSDFGTVRYADQNEMVFTLGELNRALDNDAVQDMVRKGEIQVTAQPYQDNDTFNKIDQKLKEIQPQETESIELDENEQKVLEDVKQDSEVNEARVGTRSEIIQRKYEIDKPERATAIAQKAFGEQTTGGQDAVQERQTEEVDVRQQAGDGEAVVEGGEAQTQQQQAQVQEETQEAQEAVGDLDGQLVEYDGQEGYLDVDEGGKVTVETVDGNQVFELGNVDNEQNPEFEKVQKAAPPDQVVMDENTVELYGNQYTGDIEGNTTFDQDGNVQNVQLQDEKGNTRTFRGEVAEQIVYENTLQQMENRGEGFAEQVDAEITTNEQLQKEIQDARETKKKQIRSRKGKAKRDERGRQGEDTQESRQPSEQAEWTKEEVDEFNQMVEQEELDNVEQRLEQFRKDNAKHFKKDGNIKGNAPNSVKRQYQDLIDTYEYKQLLDAEQQEQTEQPAETEQTETQEEPQQTETLTEEQQKEQVAIDEGYKGLDQAVNSVRKNLDKEVDRESITEEDIRQAAQESDSISEIQDQSEEQLVEEANEKLDQIEEGKSPAQLEVGGQKITQVINNLSPDNRSKVIDKYQDKQQQYQKQQEKLAEQKDEVAQAKESLNEAFNKWLEGNRGVGIANDPKQRAKEDVELMSALKNYAQALAARGVKNFNEFVKELPAKLKENLTNANLREAWDEGKKGVKKGTQKGAKQQTREATGQKKPDDKITVSEKKALKQQIKREAKAAKEAYRAGKREQKAFSNKIKEIVKNLKGKLTPAQQRALINKAVSVNTERSLDNFVDYATNVIENAEYATEVSRASKSQKTSRKKLKRNAYGVDDGSMSNALRVNPSLLSDEDLSRYNEFLKNINQGTFDRSQVEEEIDYFAKIGLEHRENAQKPLQEKEESEAVQIARDEAIQNFMQTQKRERVDVSEAYEEDYKALKNITENDLQGLTAPQIDELTQALNNMENDYYMSPKAVEALREIKANRKVNAGLKASEGAKLKRLLRDILNPFGTALTGEKLTKANKVRRYLTEIPLSRADSVFKGVKGTQLYKNFVEGISRMYSSFNAKSEEIVSDYDKAYRKIKKKKRNDVEVKLSLIALDKEYKNNPNNPETSPIEDYISAIQEAAKKDEEYAEKAERYVEIYQSMLNEQGEFDYVEQEKKLDQAEKNVLEYVENVHLENAKRVEVSAIRNGENITVRRYYTPLSVRLQEFTDLSEIEQAANQFGKDEDIKAVSQSGNIKARTKGAKPLHLEFSENFKASIRSTLRDYYMREEMRSVSKAINKIKANEDISSEQRALFEAIGSVLEEVTRNTFINEYYEGGLDEKIKNLLKKRGYQMDLSSIPRAGVEFSTNMGHAIISKPKEFRKGAETLMRKDLTDQELRKFVNLAGTTQFTRMFNKTQSIYAEQGGMAQESFTKIGKGIDQINNATQALPDRMLAKPVWIGSFMRKFKEQTGREFDIKEFNESQEYRSKYQSAINTASEKADTDLTQGYASLNPYEGILAAQVNKDDGLGAIFHKYMTRFMKYEFQSLVDSWEGMIGRNELTKREGGALMAATITRMGLYQTALGAVSAGTYMLIEGLMGTGIPEDERKEDDISILKRLGRGMLGSAISMFFFRRLGNWAKLPIAYGIETLNQKFGKEAGLRDGEYDSYKKSLVFNPIPVDMEPYNMRAGKIVPRLTGPYSNFTKTSFRAVTVINRGGLKLGDKYILEPSVKKEKTREKYHKELITRILPEFYMETMGLPFPRDIRNLALREVFKEYRKKEEETGGAKFKEQGFKKQGFKEQGFKEKGFEE